MLLSRDIYQAITYLQEGGYIHISPDTEILDIGCGELLGWVPELLELHPFRSYVGLDQLPEQDMRFKPFKIKDSTAESLVHDSNMDLVDWYRYYRVNRSVLTSLSVDDFTGRFKLIGNVDLRSQQLSTFLGRQKFGLIILSDLLHLLDPKQSLVILQHAKEFASPDTMVVVRYYESNTGYGAVGELVVSQTDRLFGEPVLVAGSKASPAHVTKLFRLA